MDTLKNALFGAGGLLKVRALLAYWWSGLTGYLYIDTGDAPETVLVITTGVVAYYFSTRTAEGVIN